MAAFSLLALGTVATLLLESVVVTSSLSVIRLLMFRESLSSGDDAARFCWVTGVDGTWFAIVAWLIGSTLWIQKAGRKVDFRIKNVTMECCQTISMLKNGVQRLPEDPACITPNTCHSRRKIEIAEKTEFNSDCKFIEIVIKSYPTCFGSIFCLLQGWWDLV